MDAATVNIDGSTAINIGTTADKPIDVDADTFDLDASAALTLTGAANSVIDFPNFDVATTGNITTAGDLAVNGDDITSDADLTITPAGGDLILANDVILNIGGSGTDTAYNTIADSVAGASANVDSDNDLYIEGNLEVDGTIYGNVSGTISPGFTQGSVVFINGSGNLDQDNNQFF